MDVQIFGISSVKICLRDVWRVNTFKPVEFQPRPVVAFGGKVFKKNFLPYGINDFTYEGFQNVIRYNVGMYVL